MRTTLDFAPLFRSAVGFDRVFDVLDNVNRGQDSANWPPYDIVKLGDDAYRISMAVAGFDQSELAIEQRPNLLVIAGVKRDQDNSEYLHRGIASRAFERRFELADFVRVEKAWVQQGLLHVSLVRELPEAMKPRRIEIQQNTSEPVQNAQIETLRAA